MQRGSQEKTEQTAVGKKTDGKSYRLVQFLRTINKITGDLHSVVANPYTLLNTL